MFELSNRYVSLKNQPNLKIMKLIILFLTAFHSHGNTFQYLQSVRPNDTEFLFIYICMYNNSH